MLSPAFFMCLHLSEVSGCNSECVHGCACVRACLGELHRELPGSVANPCVSACSKDCVCVCACV